jgi:hypothetical protein
MLVRQKKSCYKFTDLIMQCNWIYALLLALLLGGGCRHSVPQPEPQNPSGGLPSGASVDSTYPAIIPEQDPRQDRQVLVCQDVLEKIYKASGVTSHPMPTVFLSDNASCMAAFFPRKNAIELERKTYEVCRSFGADSLNALAVVLGHELSHAFDVESEKQAFRSNFWAYDRQPGSSVEREKSADLRGAFMAHLAGFRIVPIVPTLIKKLYVAYPKQTQSAAYPLEKERQQTALEVQGWVDTLIQVFDAANYLLAIGQGDMAAICYEHILMHYKSPEIWNNYGIACATEALRTLESPFAYPLELDWQLRLSRPRGAIPTEQQIQQREMWLKRSATAFAEALKLDSQYFMAMSNAWCINLVGGNGQTIRQEVESLSFLQSKPELYRLLVALTAAHNNDREKAIKIFEALTNTKKTEIASLALYNLNVLKLGQEAAVQKNAHSNCPIDPLELTLPSILTLRKKAAAFDGIVLGYESQLTLALEKKAEQRLIKARIGSNRFCILHLAPVSKSLKKLDPYIGFNGQSGSRIIQCKDHYLQEVKSGKLITAGIYYNYRAQE